MRSHVVIIALPRAEANALAKKLDPDIFEDIIIASSTGEVNMAFDHFRHNKAGKILVHDENGGEVDVRFTAVLCLSQEPYTTFALPMMPELAPTVEAIHSYGTGRYGQTLVAA